MTRKIGMLVATIALCGVMSMNSCKGFQTERLAPEVTEQETYHAAIDKFLVDSLGKQYASAEVCLPCIFIVKADESNTADIRIWGDYWVYNFKRVGDTLKTVSGGNHPGLMHVCRTAGGYDVVRFDQVTPGAGYEASARDVFGEHFEAYQWYHEDDKNRSEALRQVITDYIKQNNLPVKYFQELEQEPVLIEDVE